MCNKSESITKLAIALVKFNLEVKIIEKDAKNPHFKNQYASLDTIIDEVRPLLAKHGLVMMQFPGGDGEKFTLRSMLIHESGEWIESEPITMRPVKNDPQGIGSCSTYARRYSLSAMLSLNTGDDDDGNGASQGQQQNQSYQSSNNTTPPPTPPASQSSASGNCISEGQVKMVWAKMKNSQYANLPPKDVCELISAHLTKTITDFAQIEKSDINKVIAWFEKAA